MALSSAAIVSVYALGRANTSAVSSSYPADTPAAAVAAPATPSSGGGARTAPAAARSAAQGQSVVAYRDGSFVGKGTSRHGGMRVTVVIKDGKITSANVTSCGTRYPCSDVNPLVRATVSGQKVPANHISGASDSSRAYKQALADALKQAQA